MNKEQVEKMYNIQNIKPLDIDSVNKIIVKFTKNFIEVFKYHNISKETICDCLLRANIFTAKFTNSISGKYVYQLNSIYLNEELDFDNLDSSVYHELFHYLQSRFSQTGKLLQMGLFVPGKLFKKDLNLAMNEGAVQLIASKLNKDEICNVKYYGLEFMTFSSKYYPIESNLMLQASFFTGEYPLFNSCLFNNEIFLVTLSNIIGNENLKMFSTNLDNIYNLQQKLADKYNALANKEMVEEEKVFLLNSIKQEKENLKSLILNTQIILYKNAFIHLLDLVESFDDILQIQNKIKEYEKIMIYAEDDYSFEQFKSNYLFELKNKFELISAYGNYAFAKKIEAEINTLPQVYSFGIIKGLFNKIKLLLEIKMRIRYVDSLESF